MFAIRTLDESQAYSYETNLSSRQRCNIRTITARVQLKKESLIVDLKGLYTKTNCTALVLERVLS
jgi:hypothetical protein